MICTSQGSGTYLAGEEFICGWPRLHQARDNRLCVISIRGADGRGIDSAPDVRASVEQGFLGVAADYGRTSGGRWGTDDALGKITAAWQYMKDRFAARPDKVIITCGSGGMIDTLNWLRTHPTQVACITGAIPALSLTDIHDNDRATRRLEIEDRYGGAAGWAAAAPVRDPMFNLSAFKVPIRLYYSEDDPICLPQFVDPFIAGVPTASKQSLGSVGHSVPPGSAPDFWDWIRSHS
jgi:hypothetical protein